MENIKIGIPLHGKMSSRTFHSALFRERLGEKGFEPIYFLTSDYLEASPYDPKRYFELKVGRPVSFIFYSILAFGFP